MNELNFPQLTVDLVSDLGEKSLGVFLHMNVFLKRNAHKHREPVTCAASPTKQFLVPS